MAALQNLACLSRHRGLKPCGRRGAGDAFPDRIEDKELLGVKALERVTEKIGRIDVHASSGEGLNAVLDRLVSLRPRD